MQAELGNASKALRVIAVGNDDTSGGSCVRSDMNQLFAQPGGIQPGQPTVIEIDTLAPNPWVFAAPAASIAWRKVESTLYASVARVRTTTVTNDMLGVKGGQAVDILLISVDGPFGLDVGFEMDASQYRKLGLYAADATHPNVVEEISRWLRGDA